MEEKQDHNTNVNELKEVVKGFCTERDWDQFHTPKDLAIGMITEASELLEHFRFHPDEKCEAFFNDPKKKEELADEVSDVLYFILRFASNHDIDITEAFLNKMKKNAAKYPVDRSKGINKTYKEL